jgi:hypothetical protein
VARLRGTLGDAGRVVQTVVERGCRLAEPEPSRTVAGGVRET